MEIQDLMEVQQRRGPVHSVIQALDTVHPVLLVLGMVHLVLSALVHLVPLALVMVLRFLDTALQFQVLLGYLQSVGYRPPPGLRVQPVA